MLLKFKSKFPFFFCKYLTHIVNQMGLLLVLDSPCLLKMYGSCQLVSKCQIVSLCVCVCVCVLYIIFFWKSVIIITFVLEIKFQNESIILVTREKTHKNPLAHISLTHIHMFCLPYWPFFPSKFCESCEIIMCVTLWCDFWCWLVFPLFGAIKK